MRKFLNFCVGMNIYMLLMMGMIWTLVLLNPENMVRRQSMAVLAYGTLWLLTLALCLDIFHFSRAVSFAISGEKVFFEYYIGEKVIDIKDVKLVKCSTKEYKFELRNGKKIYLSRATGITKLEAVINPQIQKYFGDILIIK